jgi:hypothetical protein
VKVKVQLPESKVHNWVLKAPVRLGDIATLPVGTIELALTVSDTVTTQFTAEFTGTFCMAH